MGKPPRASRIIPIPIKSVIDPGKKLGKLPCLNVGITIAAAHEPEHRKRLRVFGIARRVSRVVGHVRGLRCITDQEEHHVAQGGVNGSTDAVDSQLGTLGQVERIGDNSTIARARIHPPVKFRRRRRSAIRLRLFRVAIQPAQRSGTPRSKRTLEENSSIHRPPSPGEIVIATSYIFRGPDANSMAAILRRLCHSTSEICPRAILTIPTWVSQMLYGVRAELLRASKAARDRGAPFESAHSGPAEKMTSPRCFGLNPKPWQCSRQR